MQTALDTVDEANETFLLKASNATNATIPAADSGTGTITDDDNAPALSIGDVTVTEGNTATVAAVFAVTLSGASGQTITVGYDVLDDTATAANSDFNATGGTVTFAPNETAKSITVNVNGDTTAENNETFKVQLKNPTGGATSTRAVGVGTITNDDGTPPPPPHLITTGAGAGAGSHVRFFDAAGAAKPPLAFFPYQNGPGVRVARGDLDADGHDEVVVSAGPGIPPVVRVFNPSGGLIAETLAYGQSFNGGVYVAVGDVNGDGKNEVITSAGPGGGPHVRTFALVGEVGTNRTLVGSNGFFGADAGHSGGLTVAAGDLDDNGTDEIIVGRASNAEPIVGEWNYNPGTGAVTFIREFLAYASAFHAGITVAAGDLDNNGPAEIVTGAGEGGGTHVRVFSAIGGGLPGSQYAYPGFGGAVNVGIGDIDGDGTNDIITGAGPGGGPHVRGFNVLMQPKATSFFAYDPAFRGGVYVAAGRT